MLFWMSFFCASSFPPVRGEHQGDDCGPHELDDSQFHAWGGGLRHEWDGCSDHHDGVASSVCPCVRSSSSSSCWLLTSWWYICSLSSSIIYNTKQASLNRKEGRKEMFYLTMHSTHFILRLYSVGHMVKDHLDSERRNPLPPHGLLFPINSKGSFICTIPQTG